MRTFRFIALASDVRCGRIRYDRANGWRSWRRRRQEGSGCGPAEYVI